MDYTVFESDLQKLAQVQATLQSIAKHDLDKFPAIMQREIKQAQLDIDDLRPRVIKYMSNYFADQVMAEAKKELSDKPENPQQ